MLQVEPFSVADLDLLDIQSAHAYLKPVMLDHIGEVKPVMEGPYSYTAWRECGVPVAACGIMENGFAWALLAPDLRYHMKAITRAVRGALARHLAERGPVYADIDDGHLEAVRWAVLLGFCRRGAGQSWVYE